MLREAQLGCFYAHHPTLQQVDLWHLYQMIPTCNRCQYLHPNPPYGYPLHIDNSKMPCMPLATGILELFSGH